MWEEHLVGGNNGKIIKLDAINKCLLNRHKYGGRKRSDDDIASFEDKVKVQRSKFEGIDNMINALGLQRDYYTIINDDGEDNLIMAAASIIKIADLEEGFTKGEL